MREKAASSELLGDRAQHEASHGKAVGTVVAVGRVDGGGIEVEVEPIRGGGGGRRPIVAVGANVPELLVPRIDVAGAKTRTMAPGGFHKGITLRLGKALANHKHDVVSNHNHSSYDWRGSFDLHNRTLTKLELDL